MGSMSIRCLSKGFIIRGPFYSKRYSINQREIMAISEMVYVAKGLHHDSAFCSKPLPKLIHLI